MANFQLSQCRQCRTLYMTDDDTTLKPTMDLFSTIRQLQLEKERLDEAIAALEKMARHRTDSESAAAEELTPAPRRPRRNRTGAKESPQV